MTPARTSFDLAPDAAAFDCRVDFAEELAAMAREDDRIVAVCNDSVGSSNLTRFGDEFVRKKVPVAKDDTENGLGVIHERIRSVIAI